MECHRTASQASVQRKRDVRQGSSTSLINEQMDLNNHIPYDILHSMVEYDSKLDFTCVPIVTDDQVLKHIHRQTYGLIWNSIRSSTISKLVRYDQSCAFVEIHRIPTNWSRYDKDLLLLKIRQKNYLNGLALRDEFVRVLQLVLQRDIHQKTTSKNNHPYDLHKLDFTRNTIQLTFHHQRDTQSTLTILFVLLVEFDISCTEFFPDTYTSLCYYEEFNDYFKYHPDMKRTRLTPSNSIKFQFDYRLMEANLCDYVLEKSSPLSSMLTSFLKLRKQWLKYVQRAANYAAQTSRKQIVSDDHRSSRCSINSVQSKALALGHHIPLSQEIEEAFDCLFSTSLLRLLFLTVCSKSKQFALPSENSIASAIEHALQLFNDALESNYLEHPLLQIVNVFPDCFLTYEMSIQIGIKKLLHEMQRDWKRNTHRS